MQRLFTIFDGGSCDVHHRLRQLGGVFVGVTLFIERFLQQMGRRVLRSKWANVRKQPHPAG